jgi:hypothetical protein
MKESFTPTSVSIPNMLIPRRTDWIVKIQPALRKAKLWVLEKSCETLLSRRELIELRAGRSQPHRRTQDLLVSILKKLGLL